MQGFLFAVGTLCTKSYISRISVGNNLTPLSTQLLKHVITYCVDSNIYLASKKSGFKQLNFCVEN